MNESMSLEIASYLKNSAEKTSWANEELLAAIDLAKAFKRKKLLFDLECIQNKLILLQDEIQTKIRNITEKQEDFSICTTVRKRSVVKSPLDSMREAAESVNKDPELKGIYEKRLATEKYFEQLECHHKPETPVSNNNGDTIYFLCRCGHTIYLDDEEASSYE